MEIPDRIITEIELRSNNGDGDSRKWIAYKNIVYDVTDCPRWQKELHERMHYTGLDLTTELPDAPHKVDVVNRPCVKVVGRLQEN